MILDIRMYVKAADKLHGSHSEGSRSFTPGNAALWSVRHNSAEI